MMHVQGHHIKNMTSLAICIHPHVPLMTVLAFNPACAIFHSIPLPNSERIRVFAMEGPKRVKRVEKGETEVRDCGR